MTRVLLVAQFYPPIVGGEERHVRNLAIALAARGHEIHVATLDTGIEPQDDDGVTLHLLGNVGRHVPSLYTASDRPLALPLPDPLSTRDLGRVVQKVQPDVVHAHNWLVNSYAALPAARRLPLVYSLHDYSHVCPTKRLMYKGAPCSGPGLAKCFGCTQEHYARVRGPVIQAAVRGGRPWRNHVVDVFAPVSRYVAEANDLDGLRWEVVPNFIPDELTRLPSLPRDPELPEGEYFFFAGDLSEQKGVATILRAYERLDPATRPRLLMVGRPVLELRQLPAGVTIGHYWDHDRVLSGFQHALAAVLPSEWPDPCPTTVLEAMAVGTPLVTTHLGGIADMVLDGESALVVRPGDPAGLAEALEQITARDLAGRLASEARRHVGRYLQSAVAEQLEGIYASLL